MQPLYEKHNALGILMEERILYWNKLKFHMTYFTNNDRKKEEREERRKRENKGERKRNGNKRKGLMGL